MQDIFLTSIEPRSRHDLIYDYPNVSRRRNDTTDWTVNYIGDAQIQVHASYARTHLAVVSKIGIGRPAFFTCPLKTCLITTKNDSRLVEYHNTDNLIKAQSLGKVRAITENRDF